MNQNTFLRSPLDPFLGKFLRLVAERERGFTPGPESDRLADALGQPRAFVDMLFISARMRGLIKPTYGRGGKAAWTVTSHGLELIERGVYPTEQAAQADNQEFES